MKFCVIFGSGSYAHMPKTVETIVLVPWGYRSRIIIYAEISFFYRRIAFDHFPETRVNRRFLTIKEDSHNLNMCIDALGVKITRLIPTHRAIQMGRHRILVADDYSKKFFDELAKYGDVVRTSNIDNDVQLDYVTILVVRSKTKVNEKLVDRMRNLECIITATHGMDHICLDILKEKGIRCYNVPVQSYDVAQGVIAYILAHSTNLVKGDRSMKRGKWKKKELKGFRIKGKTLGIIGYGRIGREVARIASVLGMKVVAYDPIVKDNKFAVTLDTLLETSDFITIHAPLTEETKGMIGKKEISKMKNEAYLINTARGGIIDEKALLDALEIGKLSGAALDVYEHKAVFENEASNKLIGNEKVIATPHSIGQSTEAVEEKGEGVIKIIRDYICGNSSN